MLYTCQNKLYLKKIKSHEYLNNILFFYYIYQYKGLPEIDCINNPFDSEILNRYYIDILNLFNIKKLNCIHFKKKIITLACKSSIQHY